MAYLTQTLLHVAVSFLTYDCWFESHVADNIQQMEAQSACEHVFLGEVDNDGGFCIGILEGGLFCYRLSVCGGVHNNFSFNNTSK